MQDSVMYRAIMQDEPGNFKLNAHGIGDVVQPLCPRPPQRLNFRLGGVLVCL